MTPPLERVPPRAWVVTFAGTAVNLCLGILYAWSVWKSKLVAPSPSAAGTAMTGLNEGWIYLTNAQGTWALVICGFVFALCMIPGGLVQDRFGPRLGATLSGLLLGTGCVLVGVLKTYWGLLLGFGLLGGIGMGLGYAAATPAAVKWFGPHRRGLVVGLVVGGFGAAAIYISPLAGWLITRYGISGSFIGLGLLFAAVIVSAAQLLSWPPAGYRPPSPAPAALANAGPPAPPAHEWTVGAMLKTAQFYGLVILFIGSAQSGLLVIANAAPMLNNTAKTIAFFASNAWLLSSFSGLINAAGRVGTGLYSDRIGRARAYAINGAISVVLLALTPTIMESKNVALLFLAVAVATWQYGGGLSLMPAMTADFFGAKDLGSKYGLVFIGWGIAFLMPQLAGYVNDFTGNLNVAFYISSGLLAATVVLSLFIRRPLPAT